MEKQEARGILKEEGAAASCSRAVVPEANSAGEDYCKDYYRDECNDDCKDDCKDNCKDIATARRPKSWCTTTTKAEGRLHAEASACCGDQPRLP